MVSDTRPGFQPFGFAGGLYDPDTGLVHFGARDYDPEASRWTTPDPLRFGAGDTGLYTYAGDDPVGASDPTGLEAFGVFATATVEAGAPFTPPDAPVGGTANAALWGFTSDDNSVTYRLGGVVDGESAVESPMSLPPVIIGVTAGLGLGVCYSNADHPDQLNGPFDQFNVNTPVGSLSFSWGSDSQGNFIYEVGASVGPSVGFSVSMSPTTTSTPWTRGP